MNTLKRGDLASVDGYKSGVVPVKILSVLTVRERFSEPYLAAIVRVTAQRPGYARGEITLVRASELVMRKTRSRDGHLMISSPNLVIADFSLRCEFCNGSAHFNQGEYSIIHMRLPCDRERLTMADWNALSAFKSTLHEVDLHANRIKESQ